MYKKFLVKNVKLSTMFRKDPGQLEFIKSGKRLSKRDKKRAMEAVAFLKGIKWLIPKTFEYSVREEFVLNGRELDRFIYDLLGENYKLGIRDSLVIMGSQQFVEFSRGVLAKWPMCIPMADFQTENYQPEFYGMKIIVLPWMDGVVLVPKEYFPIDRQLVPSGIMVKDRSSGKIIYNPEDEE